MKPDEEPPTPKKVEKEEDMQDSKKGTTFTYFVFDDKVNEVAEEVEEEAEEDYTFLCFEDKEQVEEQVEEQLEEEAAEEV